MSPPARRPHPNTRWFSAAPLGILFQPIPPGPATPPPAGAEAALLDVQPPASFDPAPWLPLAAQAGCRYAILAVRDMLDPIEPFINACRLSGLKWGLQLTATGANADGMRLEDLLGRYDPPDVLTLDGEATPDLLGVIWTHTPGAVVGTDSRAGGDFQIAAPDQPRQRPEGWTVRPQTLNLYSAPAPGSDALLRGLLVALVEARARGDNLLIHCPIMPGVDPSPVFKPVMSALRLWMGHSAEAISGTRSGPWPDQSDVPVTTRGDTWYLHFTSPDIATAQVDAIGRPSKSRLLRTGTPVPFDYLDGSLTVSPPPDKRTPLVDIVAVTGVTIGPR